MNRRLLPLLPLAPVTVIALVLVASPAAPVSASDRGKTTALHVAAPDKSGGWTDSNLQRVVAKVRAGQRVSPATGVVTGAGVRVEVIASSAGTVAAVGHQIVSGGGRVINTLGTLILADVPATQFGALNKAADVALVRLPLKVNEAVADSSARNRPTLTSASPEAPSFADVAARVGTQPAARTASTGYGKKGADGVQKTRAAAMQAAGFTGSGVKIGIIDGFDSDVWKGAAKHHEVPAHPAGSICRFEGSSCDIWNGGSEHGTAVTEVVKDMAPDATVYIAEAETATDLKAVVDYFSAHGVKIITRSLTAQYDGAGDGTGPIADAMAYAVSKGMAWFNSAGNSGGRAGRQGSYFRSAWNDPDGDGWLNFPDGTEYMGFGCSYINGLRWNDWGAAVDRSDYDVYVYDEGFNETNSSTDNQQDGALPLEHPECSSEYAYLAVKLYNPGSGTAGDILEFMDNGGGVEFPSNPYSVTGPAADSSTPGTASVGAVDPVSGVTIADYSAQGPTNDGRTKPDLSAASGMTSYTYSAYGDGRFSGTSSSTPAVAGSAALVLQQNPTFTPAQLVYYLEAHTNDRGAAGTDTTYGAGELALPGAGSSITALGWSPTPGARISGSTVPTSLRWKASTLTGRSSYSVWRALAGGSFGEIPGPGSGGTSLAQHVAIGTRASYAVQVIDWSRTHSAYRYTPDVTLGMVDDRSARVHYSGAWSKVASSGSWASTTSESHAPAARARLTFTGSSVAVVLRRSPESGHVGIYLDGVLKSNLNTRSAASDTRRIVASYAFATKGTHTITIRPIAAGGHSWLRFDGFLVTE